MSDDYLSVTLDVYTVGVDSTLDGHRWWSQIGAPVALHFLPDGSCAATVVGETTTVTLAEAERLLIENGLIDPALDDPSVPVNAFVSEVRRRQRLQSPEPIVPEPLDPDVTRAAPRRHEYPFGGISPTDTPAGDPPSTGSEDETRSN
jgi:hypothetical protein